ncbi:MAG: cbb3-type cytochrome oxidase assembly protein CcoS [Gammaproteobacteria bacterium]|nr:MAG: cbb3-type cytochrome oxidase assembly protein CcoS [Gammaproteobacteria bacterium]
MEILYLLIPLAVVLLAVAVGAFVWASRSGQFDDMEGPAYRILMDDDTPRPQGEPHSAETASGPRRSAH